MAPPLEANELNVNDQNKPLRRDRNRMSKRAGPGNRSDAREHPLRTGLALGLLAVLAMVFWLAFWPRADAAKLTSSPTAEPGVSAFGQSHSTQPAARHSATGNRMKARELSPAALAKHRHLEEVWAAFLAAQALADPMARDAALNRCMAGMSPELAADLLAGLGPEDLKGVAARRLFDHWATGNPGEAAAWAQGQGDPETRQSYLNVAALRWAATDLKAAADWARSLPEGEGRTEIMAAVGAEAVRSDPLEALRMGVELPAGAAQADLISRAAAEWAVTDRDSAVAWAKQIEDEALRQRVTGQVVVASAEQDPAGAATIALQQMPLGEERDRALVSVVQRWVQTDPAVASAWVSEFPEGAVGRDAMDNLVNLWADRDLVASGNWLLTLRAGELRNVGILAYARVLRRTDAALADRWASSVTGGQ